MKNSLKTVALSAMLIGTTLLGDTDGRYSLVGIEGGMSSMTSDTTGAKVEHDFAHLGLKIGAQSEDYRIFISGRSYMLEIPAAVSTTGVAEDDRAFGYGIEFQRLLNFGESFNLFIGGGMGKIGGEIVNAGYVNADIGVNVIIAERFNLELGTKIMNVSGYKDFTTLYSSLIYRFDTD